VLDARAEPGGDETAEERRVASREARRDEAERRGGRARREQPGLAPALREETGRDLERGHAVAVGRAQQADLRKGEAELPRPDREEDVEDVREAVVDEVRAAGGTEHGPGAAGHAPDCSTGAEPGAIRARRRCPSRVRRRLRGRARARSAALDPSCEAQDAGAIASSRAGMLLCHGVPTHGSRSSLAVNSFGATPVRTRCPPSR